MSSILKVDTIQKSDAGAGVHIAGHQVQLVHSTNSQTNQNPASNTAWNTITNQTLSITPKYANSLIKVELYVNILLNSVTYAGAGIRRDSTDIGYFWGYSVNASWRPWSPSIAVIDTPNTTSAITYRPIANMTGSTLSNYLWNYQGPSADLPLRVTRMIATEIAQ